MLDYYKTRNPSIVHSQQINSSSDWDIWVGSLSVYGEAGVFPQFGEHILRSKEYDDQLTMIYVIPDNTLEDVIREEWRVFGSQVGGHRNDGIFNMCDERIPPGKDYPYYEWCDYLTITHGVINHEYQEDELPFI